MKYKKLTLFTNLAFLILILVCDAIFMSGICSKYFIKTLTSALFVLCGAFNLALAFVLYKKSALKSIILFVGIVFAFIGDVLLIDHFVLGAIFFAIGHLFFLVYFFTRQPINYIDGLLFVVLCVFAMLLIVLYKGFKFDGMQVVVIVYAIIISTMLAKAISNMIVKPSPANLVILAGAFLFYFSDLMLLFDVFTNISPVFDYLCLCTYYPAEFLLAISLLLANVDPKFKKQPANLATQPSDESTPKLEQSTPAQEPKQEPETKPEPKQTQTKKQPTKNQTKAKQPTKTNQSNKTHKKHK